MAYPTPGVDVASYDKTANSYARNIDSVLYPMICAKSQLIDRFPKQPVDGTKYEWESANTRGKTFVSAAPTDGTGVVGSASATEIGPGTGIGATLQAGSLIRNASVATPIGTYGADEIMLVTSVAANGDLQVKRNVGQPVGSTTNSGSTAHTATATYEILYSPKHEGSSPDENKYKDVSLEANYTSILDFYLTVTGSQLASKRLIAADSLQRQFDDRLIELKNEMESMLLYGVRNPGSGATGADTEANAWTGTDSYARMARGFQQFQNVAAAYSAGLVDYATKAVTEDAINTLVANLITAGNDMTNPLILVAHPNHIRTINAFGADKVRITQDETKWGRALKTLETDLGVSLELVPCLNMSKSDLFIIDTKKVFLTEFRPFVKMEWGIDTSTPDGTDAWKQRYLGEYGVKVIDAAKSHASIEYITW
jgi:hypothetical protein